MLGKLSGLGHSTYMDNSRGQGPTELAADAGGGCC